MEEILYIVPASNKADGSGVDLLAPFYEEQSILDIICHTLQNTGLGKTMIATSCEKTDDAIADFARSHNLLLYRGEEPTGVSLLAAAIRESKCTYVVRVNPASPYLSGVQLRKLIKFDSLRNYDYIGFKVKNRPATETGLPLWAECISVETIQKVSDCLDNTFHWTRCIYNHPDRFSIAWLRVDESVDGHEDLKLSVDKPGDFENNAKFYTLIRDNCSEVAVRNIMRYIDAHPECIDKDKNIVCP